MLGAYGAPFDIIDDICINVGPVNCLTGLGLHLLYPLVCTVEVSEGSVKEHGGYVDFISLQENTDLNGQLVPGAPEMMGDPQDLLKVVRPSPKG